VKFCHRIGLTYVSCSPFRVPVARLSAAQAALEDEAFEEVEEEEIIRCSGGLRPPLT
jgi:pyruvate,orthophosphate dikinase